MRKSIFIIVLFIFYISSISKGVENLNQADITLSNSLYSFNISRLVNYYADPESNIDFLNILSDNISFVQNLTCNEEHIDDITIFAIKI